jgi:hypothetical protein
LFLLLILHVIENPVPHDEEPGDDNAGEQPGTGECPGEDGGITGKEFWGMIVLPGHPGLWQAILIFAMMAGG